MPRALHEPHMSTAHSGLRGPGRGPPARWGQSTPGGFLEEVAGVLLLADGLASLPMLGGGAQPLLPPVGHSRPALSGGGSGPSPVGTESLLIFGS